MKEGLRELAAKVKSFIGVPQPAQGVERIPQLEAACAAADVAIADAQEAKELALLAVEDGERGARERLAAASGELQASQKAKDEILDALRTARRVADRQVAEASRKTRAMAWREAERLAGARVAAAGNLAEALRAAGEHYATFLKLSADLYDTMPARWHGGPSSYRLASGDAAAVVGIDVLRAGLPDVAQISPSMLPQYPNCADVAASTLDMVRLTRREDEALSCPA